jgi:chloramphenicol 3-O-phosphotransferase
VASDRRGRLVFVSGACGSGKTTVLSLGLTRMRAVFGGDTAALDTDRISMFIDPRWELKHPEAERYWELTGRQWVLLARSYFDFGFAAVVIGGNGVWNRSSIGAVAAAVADQADTYHVSLDTSLDVVCARIAERGDDMSPDWLRTHVEWMRERYAEGWTYVIDNSAMTPDETLDAIAAAVDSGVARFPAGERAG